MAQINLKLDERQVERTTQLAKQLNMKRAAYIRKAIDAFNSKTERSLLSQRLKAASAKCRGESLKVCHEFEQVDPELE